MRGTRSWRRGTLRASGFGTHWSRSDSSPAWRCAAARPRTPEPRGRQGYRARGDSAQPDVVLECEGRRSESGRRLGKWA
ncbi:uncharacterized protein B0H18DRAFT_1064919 [Fomitopsis serialis]|uniref:uncharacterized protein n=1 Tax=Fomitopsis serialis TaxID=139415 RepID=UPI002007E0B5|nr:uncharacterized protein B0H18DRAFT_1064919 [Neoantrodia serialis]KAH9911011.1 hypothetical protein B0H18DRAFT_1064919 [Neoantrodia serialis]